MKLYKLTDANDQTHGGCQWGEGVTIVTDGKGDLCGPGFTHWYTDPLIAVFMNPIHARFNPSTMHLWEGEGEVIKTDSDFKVGCTKATTLKRVPLPEISIENRVKIAILCAKKVCKEPVWNTWADNWLSGKDRSRESAAAVWTMTAAAWATAAAAWATATAAAWATTEAARAAACAAEAATAAAAEAATETAEFDLLEIIHE